MQRFRAFRRGIMFLGFVFVLGAMPGRSAVGAHATEVSPIGLSAFEFTAMAFPDGTETECQTQILGYVPTSSTSGTATSYTCSFHTPCDASGCRRIVFGTLGGCDVKTCGCGDLSVTSCCGMFFVDCEPGADSAYADGFCKNEDSTCGSGVCRHYALDVPVGSPAKYGADCLPEIGG